MTKLALLLVLVPAIAAADKTYTGGKGATWDCKKDPTIYINHGSGKYTFTGDCKSIHINGGKNTLVIASVDALTLSGGKNKVTIGTVDSIKIEGADNQITWKKAKSGDKPTVDGQGANEQVSQAK